MIKESWNDMDSMELLRSAKSYIIFEGVLAVLMGLIIMLWPGLTVATIILFIGIYGIIHGVVLVGMGIFAQKGEERRSLSIGTGILSILFGLIVLNMPVLYAAFNLYVIAAMIGVEGIFLMVHSFTSDETMGHKIMMFIAGVLTILFAIWAMFNPLSGGLLLVFFLSLTLIISGSLTIVAGVSIKTK